MATDLAEFIGAALGFNLLFGMPLFLAGAHDGRHRLRDPRAAGARLPPPRGRDHRPRRRDLIGFAFQVFLAEPSASGVAHGLLTPQFAGSESVLLAVGILGATVMPHVIYLHSALTQRRVVGRDDERAAADLPLRAGRRRHRDEDRRRRST